MCSSPNVTESVRAIVDSVASYASKHGEHFSAIGVALDWSLPAGTRYLEEFRRFDEALIGSNWLNTGVIKVRVAGPTRTAFATSGGRPRAYH